MGFILDLASGEQLADEPSYVCDRAKETPRTDLCHTLQCPQPGLALAEYPATEQQTSPIASLDISALIDSIKD